MKMGRREGRFPGAPSRAGREGKRTTERVASFAFPVPATSPALEAAKGVERGIRAFNNLVGEEEKEVSKFIFWSDIVLFRCKNLPSQRAGSILRGMSRLHVHADADADAVRSMPRHNSSQ